MTTLDEARERANSRRRTGLMARVRATLAEAEEPATSEELAAQLGVPLQQMRSAIGNLVNTNQVRPISGHPYRYELGAWQPEDEPKRKNKKSGSGVIAGRLLIRGYKT